MHNHPPINDRFRCTMVFKDEQLAQLAASGWSRCHSVARAVADAGLSPITVEYLGDAFCVEQWETVETMTVALTDSNTSR